MLYQVVLLLLYVVSAQSSTGEAAAIGSLAVGPGWNEPALNRQIVRPILVAQHGQHKRQLVTTRHDVDSIAKNYNLR